MNEWILVEIFLLSGIYLSGMGFSENQFKKLTESRGEESADKARIVLKICGAVLTAGGAIGTGLKLLL